MSLLLGIDEAPDKRGCLIQGRIDFSFCHGCRFEITGIGCCFFTTSFGHLEHLDRELRLAGFGGPSFMNFFRERAVAEDKAVIGQAGLTELDRLCGHVQEWLDSSRTPFVSIPLLLSIKALVRKALAIDESLEVS